MSRAIFIIGPQGSGSSALAGALHSMGIHMGDKLKGSSKLNPKGHFEDEEFEDIAFLENADINDVCSRVEDYIKKRNQREIWGLKLFFIPGLFKFMFPNLDECRVLSIDRPPEGCIKSSLEKYGHFRSRESIEDMHARIRKNRERIIEEFCLKNLDVNFNNLTDNTAYEIGRIVDFCFEGMQKPEQSKIDEAIAFIDPKLNHKRENL
jgi:hypothetical protein